WVRIVAGRLAGRFATVEAIDPARRRLDVSVATYGRVETVGVGVAEVEPGAPTLFLTFRGERYPITSDCYRIGRMHTTDLAIDDRQIEGLHAVVVKRNGAYYVWDLRSTAGVVFRGLRIENKRIEEGDVFALAGHELQFTYRAG